MAIQQDVDTLVNLVKNSGMEIILENYDQYDDSMKKGLQQWLDDNGWSDARVPINHLGLDSATVAWFKRKIKVYIFDFYYDGSDTGTDPCGGQILFSSDGTSTKQLLDTVHCGD